MPIEALPPATIRAIGSTSVISDPCSVVKELVDNALDASASSLLIEISTNTLDVIQLRDNGHGIPAEDYPSVCKHTFTSKIQTIDDLRNVGCASFGFRGEALASIAETSGAVTVTTRVASDVTGSCLKYARDGGLSQSQRTSHPIGTTLRITDFLKHIPVRRQTALKGAAKNLAKIKKLLQAYAIAQPSKRLSLKVLKAKNENNNWMYAPTDDASLSDAAIKVVGREVSLCCTIKTLESQSNSIEGEDPGRTGYKLLAFLPKADADLSKVSNMGQFVSVDGRPLSTTRGIAQDIAKLFKSYIRAVGSRNEAPRSIAEPFLCLHLNCPPGSYDVNIEPGKDDVLFEDRETVMALIDGLFCDHYGPLPNSQQRSTVKTRTTASNSTQRDGSFELLMARKHPTQPPTQPEDFERYSQDDALASPLSQGISELPGTARPEAVAHNTTSCQPNIRSNPREGRESRFVNPWSITRINASFQTPQRNRPLQPIRSQLVSSSTSPQRRSQDSPGDPSIPASPQSPELLSPPVSRFASTSPVGCRRNPRASQDSPGRITSDVMSSRKAARERDRERYGNGALDTWFQRTTQLSLQSSTQDPTSQLNEDGAPFSRLAKEKFMSPSIPSANEAVDEVETHPQANESSSQDSPGSPDSVNNAGQDSHSRPMDSGRGFPVLENWAAKLREGVGQERLSGLEWALDFERRKKEAIQQHRTRSNTRATPSSSQISSTSSQAPHHSRYLAAKAALVTDRPFATDAVSTPTLSPRDPRAYLIRHQSDHNISTNGAKPRRLHTTRLPFEHIPEGYDLHNACLPMATDISDISRSFDITSTLDIYTRSGKENELLQSDADTAIPFWNARLTALINEKYRNQDGAQAPDWQADISSVMKNHFEKFSTS
ncbi:uncharacterized protein N7459_002313 [Penicillium hispanicum]|uniref:uncharacterized protein n=1 Tax=Penicillium hispanicum TaxID=1080232 RepID=UPI00254084A8|nr:uncharacterized protein N7459_002313 [Penicillium hispanicum]KAJ5591944.1 hypothetical protein N7459_002313 [Penicillium hispanicum]